MVIMKCRSCGVEVSPDALVCPNCGAQSPTHRRVVTYATVVKGAAIVIAILLVYNLVIWLRRP